MLTVTFFGIIIKKRGEELAKLIVIDNNPLEGEAYAHIIQHGYPNIQYMGQAFTGIQGLGLVKEVQPDIAFVDTEISGDINGLMLIRAINEISPNTSIVVISIYEEEFHYLQNAIRFGVSDYYLKPVNNQDLHMLFSKLESKNKPNASISNESNRDKFRDLVDTIQSGKPDCANVALRGFWDIAMRSQNRSVESLSIFCIEFATSVMYYSGGQKYQPAILSLAYARFIKGVCLCTMLEEIYGKLADFLNECADALNQSIDDVSNPQIKKAKELIESFIENGKVVTLEAIAREVFLSPVYLSRLFKKSENINFVDYVHNYRLNKAKLLLSETKDSVAIIAKKCGYEECNSFRRLFKKKLGLSPTEYREMV